MKTLPNNQENTENSANSNTSSSPFQSSLAQPNQHQIPEINLPKGGGALRGIDEKMNVNPVTGSSGMGIPLPVAPARGGFSPALSIQYSSGAGNGLFGMGWGLSLASISRKTNKELPKYQDGENSDTFLMGGVEDLIPKLENSTGAWLPVVRQEANYEIREYRPRIEGSWQKIEQWIDQTTGLIHWRTISSSNIIAVYGDTPSSRIANPQDLLQIFEWKISYSYDNLGNLIIYEYQQENLLGVAPSIYEKNRTLQNVTNTYLKRVHYGNKTPYYHGDALPASTDFLFETVLDYGDHALVPDPSPSQDWEARADAFSSFRAGFDIRTYRCCKRVLLFHKFDSPTDQAVPNLLVSALELTYEDYPEAQLSNPHLEGFTYLKAAQVRGYKYDDLNQTYQSKTRPPVQLYYQKHAWDTTIHELEEYTHLPMGINQGSYQWVDFYGEGIAGILNQENQGWYYQENLGEGTFSPAALLSQKPSMQGWQFKDLEGNGQRQLVNYNNALQGFFESKNNGEWEHFQYFEALPNRNLSNDPYARFIDLDGDGRADLLITTDELFEWHASKGKEGFGKANFVYTSLEEEEGPRVVFADQEQSIFLADMTGDGMTDIVRIRNGELCYWANMGYGKFSAKISMKNAPTIDSPEQFNPQYLYLLDIDGSGTTDIAYYHQQALHVWCNWSGNEFAMAPQIINPFPSMDQGTRLDVIDLLGQGTSCLVWSSGQTKDQNSPLKYINLTGGKKPHLLYAYKNNLGASVELEYKHSTYFYLEAKKAGTPWATKLPFPVHVVHKITSIDAIRNTVFTQQYSYAHGYYDRIEREFRGFGKVEVLDTESLDSLSQVGAANVHLEHYQVPIKTVSWYHTGAALEEQQLSTAFQREYYQNPSIEQPLENTIIPTGLTDQEYGEAFRACKGLLLRQEIYSLDTTNPEHIHPYATSEQSYQVRLVQAQEGQKYASFQALPVQSFSYNYDRNPNDPRISQDLVLALDEELGIPTQTASIVYPRVNIPNGLPWMVAAEQSKVHVVINSIKLNNTIDTANSYRLKTACEEQVYELLGKTWAAGQAYFLPSLIKADFDAAQDLDFVEEPSVATTIYKRLHGQTKVEFLADDAQTRLLGGQQDALGLPYKTYQLAYTPLQLTELYTTAAGSNLLTGINLLQEGYVDLDGDGKLWLHSGTTIYGANVSSRFYMPTGVEDILGNQSFVQYDAYQLLPIQTQDAIGNIASVEYDYRVLQAKLMVDLNQNQAAVAFDALGIVTKTAVLGKVDPITGQAEGDDLDHPTMEMSYNFFNWMQHQKPNYIHSRVREEHHSQNPNAVWQESYEYSDGNGAVILKKTQTKDGEALQWDNGTLVTVDTSTLSTKRWIGNGRTILNNKGMPIKQYEPYFSATHEFEDAPELVEIGFSPVLYYDAAGRNNYTELPNGTFLKVEFDAWKSTSYDVNDTVLDSDWYTNALASGNAKEQRAANLSAQHANTPMVTHLDCLGRTIYAENIAPNPVDNTALYTQTDLAGRFSQAYDQLATQELLQQVNNYNPPRGRSSWSRTNLLGQTVCTESAVKGAVYQLTDALGRLLKIWNNPDTSKSLILRTDYDVLHRPTATYVQQGNQAEICFAQTSYGEGLPNDIQNNLRGQAYQTKDQAGVLTSHVFDFKDNALRVSRQLPQIYNQTIDWNQSIALETDVFETSSLYDALNRPTLTTLPDQSQFKPTYNEGGYLEKMEVNILGAGTWQTFLDGQDFDAKGQKQWQKYGNGSWTEYFYDAKTFRLDRLVTYKDANQNHTLQDLQYTYDPAGNIMEVVDDAQSTFYYNNQAISPRKTYEYDHLYRLIQATGREHIGANAPNHQDFGHLQGLPHQHIQGAVRNYTQTYQYDAVGNILEMKHQTGAATGNWTRQYTYATNATNQLLTTQIGSNIYQHNHYDQHGNMTKMPHLQALTWNFADQLVEVQLNAVGDKAYYNYDNGGQRVRKVIQKANKRTERLYLGGVERYREYDASNQVTLERWTLMVEGIALVETETGKPPLIRYQYTNHLGSAALETDANGNLISYEEYHPYGTTAYSTYVNASYAVKRYRFTNKERDDETGLYYFGVRYYAAWLGRWTSSDPGGFIDGLNLYRYVRNNPVNLTDPTGMSPEPPPEINLYRKFDNKMLSSFLKIKGQPLPSPENKNKTEELIRKARNIMYPYYPVKDFLLQDFGHDYVNYMWYISHFRGRTTWEKSYQGKELIGAVGEAYAMNRSKEGFGNIFNEDKKYITATFRQNPDSPSSANDGTWDFRGNYSSHNLFYYYNQYGIKLNDKIEETRVKDLTLYYHNAQGEQNVPMEMAFSEESNFDVVFEVKTWNPLAYSGSILRKALEKAIAQTNRHIEDTGADYGVLILPEALWEKAIEEGIAEDLYEQLDDDARLFLLEHIRTDAVYHINEIRDRVQYQTTDEQSPQPDELPPPTLPPGVSRG